MRPLIEERIQLCSRLQENFKTENQIPLFTNRSWLVYQGHTTLHIHNQTYLDQINKTGLFCSFFFNSISKLVRDILSIFHVPMPESKSDVKTPMLELKLHQRENLQSSDCFGLWGFTYEDIAARLSLSMFAWFSEMSSKQLVWFLDDCVAHNFRMMMMIILIFANQLCKSLQLQTLWLSSTHIDLIAYERPWTSVKDQHVINLM